MGKKWRQLKYEDRLKIYAWLQDKTSVATIAKRLGVCRHTIYREIKRRYTIHMLQRNIIKKN